MHAVELSKDLPQALHVRLRTLLAERCTVSVEQTLHNALLILPAHMGSRRCPSATLVKIESAMMDEGSRIDLQPFVYNMNRPSHRLFLFAHIAWFMHPQLTLPPQVDEVLRERPVTLSLVRLVFRYGIGITSGEVCRRVAIHEITLRRMLREESSVRPRTALTIARMLFVAQQLEQHGRSLERLSNDLLFSAAPNFCRFSRRTFGMAPNAARSRGAMTIALAKMSEAFPAIR